MIPILQWTAPHPCSYVQHKLNLEAYQHMNFGGEYVGNMELGGWGGWYAHDSLYTYMKFSRKKLRRNLVFACFHGFLFPKQNYINENGWSGDREL